MGILGVREIMARYNVHQTTIIRWIKSGNLKAEKVPGSGRHGFHYSIDENDLQKFIDSHYSVSYHQCDRIPDLEDCYPVNIVRAMFGDKKQEDDGFPRDYLEVNYKLFREMITRLTDKEQRVLEMRFHIGATLEECGTVFGLTRERIRMIEVKALRKLRTMAHRTSIAMVPKAEYDLVVRKNEILESENKKFGDAMYQIDPLFKYVDVKIEELNLNVRPYNCLKRKGINTIGDIIQYDKEQTPDRCWLLIRNLGKRSLEEVATKVFAFCGYRIHDAGPAEGVFSGFVDIPGVPQTMTKLQEVEA